MFDFVFLFIFLNLQADVLSIIISHGSIHSLLGGGLLSDLLLWGDFLGDLLGDLLGNLLGGGLGDLLGGGLGDLLGDGFLWSSSGCKIKLRLVKVFLKVNQTEMQGRIHTSLQPGDLEGH
jgi:hypothetical protein